LFTGYSGFWPLHFKRYGALEVVALAAIPRTFAAPPMICPHDAKLQEWALEKSPELA
jgi:hypothetical protein